MKIGICLANIIMVFHRILDFKMGWISILALFYLYYLTNQLIPHQSIKLNSSIIIIMKKASVLLVTMSILFLHQQTFSQTQKSNGDKGLTNPMQIGSFFVNGGFGAGAGYKNPTYGTPWGFKLAAEYGMWQAGPGVITLGAELGSTFSGEDR